MGDQPINPKGQLNPQDAAAVQGATGLPPTPDAEASVSVDHTGAEDVSRIVGTIVATVGGKTYTVGPFGFIHWGTTQSLLLKEKRARIIQAVRDAREVMGSDPDQGGISQGEYQVMLREAMSQAGNESSLGPADANYIVATPEGLGTCLWVLIEDQYKADPHRPTRKQCQAEVFTALSGPDSELLGEQILACMGITPGDSAGNESGQSQNA